VLTSSNFTLSYAIYELGKCLKFTLIPIVVIAACAAWTRVNIDTGNKFLDYVVVFIIAGVVAMFFSLIFVILMLAGMYASG
jgi:hypothetical protein